MRMIHIKVEPPITKDDGMELKGVISFYILKLSLGKAVL